MELSYRRAWTMVDSMNRCFQKPLVEKVKAARHGASLTADGEAALAADWRLQADLSAAGQAEAATPTAMLRA
jgi:molybdate transport system regulatory protein